MYNMICGVAQFNKTEAVGGKSGSRPCCITAPTVFFIGDMYMRQYKRIIIAGKYTDEHRLIMEQYLGRRLTRLEVVHHKDGNGRNNDIENLELMSLSDHSQMHVKLIMTTAEARRRGIKGLRSKINREDVLEIRQLLKAGMPRRTIASFYDITQTTVSSIKTRKRWGHVV